MSKNSNAMERILKYNGDPSMKMTIATIMTLALPAIIEQMMITMVQYVDTAMVGSLGSNATAAVGLTASTTWLIGGILNAAAIGFSVQVAQLIGAQQIERAKSVIGQAVQFIFVFGTMIGIIAFAVSYPLPMLLGAEKAIRGEASLYFRIIACSVPFNFCSLMLSSIIRCSGDSRTPMILNLSINLINIVLNFLLIYPTRKITFFGYEFNMIGAGMGVSGAALGSFLSLFIVSVMFMFVLYCKKSDVRMPFGRFYRFEKGVLLSAWKLGLPVALERSLTCIAQIIITSIITSVGTVAVAANHLAVTAESLSYMPAYGLSSAGTAMVGQAMGARRLDLAKRFSRITTYIGVIIMTLGGVLLYILAPDLIRIFSNEAEVIALGTSVLRIVAFAEPCFAMAIVITGILRGAGDTKAPFLISFATMWGIRITVSLLLSKPFGLVGIWLAMAIELCARGILFMIRLYRNKWLEIKLIND